METKAKAWGLVKKDIHPSLNPVLFLDISTGRHFPCRSTMTSDRTEVIDGVQYYVIPCSVTSDSHPVYTGQQRFVDTAGRVDKFAKRYGATTVTSREQAAVSAAAAAKAAQKKKKNNK